MARRVLHEDPRDLEHALLVRERDGRPVHVGGERMLAGLGPRAELLADGAGALGDVDLRLLDGELVGIEARQVEEVGRQFRQARHLRAHLLDELLPVCRVDVLVGHQLEKAAEREERSAELMRGVADELAACAVEMGKALAHPVEGARELPDLVFHRIDDLLLEVAGGDPARSQLQPADAVRQAERRQRAREPGDEEGDDARDEERPLDELDARQRVAKRRREQDGRVLVEQHRHLASRPVTVDSTGLRPTGLERRPRNGVVGDVLGADGIRVRDRVDGVLAERLEDDDAGAEVRLEEARHRVVVERAVLREPLHDLRSAALELVDPVRDEAVLEPRHDSGVDDAERARDDREHDEAELDGEARMPKLVHVTSRKR